MSDDRQSSFWAAIIKKIIGLLVGLLGTGKGKASIDQYVQLRQGRWIVKSGAQSSSSQDFENQELAVAYAKEVAKQFKSQVVILDKDGAIAQKISFRQE